MTEYDHEMAVRLVQYNTLTDEEKKEQDEWANWIISLGEGLWPFGRRWVRETGGYSCLSGGSRGHFFPGYRSDYNIANIVDRLARYP